MEPENSPPDVEPVAPAEPVPPKDDGLAEIRAMMAQMSEKVASMAGAYDALVATRNAGNAPTTPAAAPEVDLSALEGEIEQAIAEGKPVGKTIRSFVEASVARATAKVIAEHIGPLAATINTYGIPTLSAHARAIVGRDLKHYDRFKGEIEKALAQMTPEARVLPESVRGAYDWVIGQHHDELEKEAVAQALRGQQANPGGGPTGITGRSQGDTKVPTAAELFGADAGRAIAEKGGEDAFAVKFGFKSWADYLESTQPKEKAA